ncbi:uncharacterized protein LOC108200274 isoform X2 [Daucus carota subsp. sativus]|uniref:uncharacterized protein LOC108200274 isoform X2 n=1 Tax=Daucus carota subsp. sativus TaxID=79200 RepID=UPI003083B90D
MYMFIYWKLLMEQFLGAMSLHDMSPELFITSLILAIPKAIYNAGIEASQVDFYEINEDFAVVALANQKLLGLDLLLVIFQCEALSCAFPASLAQVILATNTNNII